MAQSNFFSILMILIYGSLYISRFLYTCTTNRYPIKVNILCELCSTEYKKSIIAVLIDLKRAFETIDQKILLEKLSSIGIRDIELDWFANFLTNRKQRTIIGSALSDEVDVKIGLPQGSVLAPILFNIYINDIKSILKFITIKLFADDALISINGRNEHEIREKLQSDLDALYIWMCDNRLKINIEKTKYMVITRKNIAHFETKKNKNKFKAR